MNNRRPAPRTAQPGRGGHHHGRRGREQRRGGERRARHPGAVREVSRELGRAHPADQGEDPLREEGRDHRPGSQPGQQPEPAPTERGRDHHGRRGQERHLDQAGEDPGRRAEAAGHVRGWPEEPPARDPRDRDRAAEQQTRRDQPDHVSRMAVAGGRREASRRDRDRRAAHHRSAGRAVSGTGGWAERSGRCAVQRRWSVLTASAASSAHEVPRRTPARASDSQCAPR